MYSIALSLILLCNSSILLSILWGWNIDNVTPDKFDLIGGFIALVGVIVIMYAPRG